jgi:inhibitor of cysteine peptidase
MIADKLMRTTVLMALILALALFSGCGSREHLVTASDNEGEVRLQNGEALVIRLESNPTTGYSWQVTEIDNAMLVQDGDPAYKQSPGNDGLAGAGGEETIRFKALGSGRTTLMLGYMRPWEDLPPLQTFRIQVVVE